MSEKLAEAPFSENKLRRGISILKKIKKDLMEFDPEEITKRFPPEVEAIESRIERAANKLFNEESGGWNRIMRRKDLGPMSVEMMVSGMPGPSVRDYINDFNDARPHTIGMLNNEIEFLEEELADLSSESESSVTITRPKHNNSTAKVFIVHGHDEGLKQTIARFLEKQSITPIILHEQTSKGRTIIEKIEHHSDVGFAIVLITPDDIGGKSEGELQRRARQNVIMELGYFLGLLGREKVVAINDPNVELPSDITGIIYLPVSNWKIDLAKELRDAGYNIDMNKVI